jgi:signal transduction histidine kinase
MDPGAEATLAVGFHTNGQQRRCRVVYEAVDMWKSGNREASSAADHVSLRGAGSEKDQEASAPRRAPSLRTRPAVVATAGVSAAVTVLSAEVPGLDVPYRNPDLHLALLVAEALIAMLSAYLVLGRFRRRRMLDDLVLCAALVALATSNLLFAAVPAVVGSDTSVFSTWSALLGRLLGAALFAAAAVVPSRRLRLSRRQLLAVWVGVGAVLGAIAAGVGWFEPRLASGVEVMPGSSARPQLDGAVAVLVAQALAFGLLTVAAIGFTARAERTGDALLGWLAVGAVLGATARMNYLLYPSVFTEYVYLGDAFRLLSYIVVLLAALSEIRSYWRSLAENAVLAERQRIARELHDGLAQELASIARNLQWLADDDRFAARARASAERAIAESRRAVAALADRHTGPLDCALAAAAQQIGKREGVRVVVSVDDTVQLPAAEHDAVVRIASEAVANAARHGRADVIRVEVTGGRRPRLRVEDSGRGFDASADQRAGHYGLRSMRERAEAIGADFRLESRVGEGTRVEVQL